MRTPPPHRRFFAVLLAALLTPAVAETSVAETRASPPPREPVQLALIAAGPLQAGLEVRLQPGWKFYWRNPGEGGVPPRFDWSASRNLAAAEVAWPAPRRITIGGVDLHGYSGEVVLPLTLKPQEAGKRVTLDLKLEYGICKDICILREDSLSRVLPAGAAVDAAAAAKLARWQAEVPVPAAAAGIRLLSRQAEPGRLVLLLDSGQPFAQPDLFVEGAPEVWFGRPEISLAEGGKTVRFVVPVQPAEAAAALPLTLTLTDTGRSDAGRAVEFTLR